MVVRLLLMSMNSELRKANWRDWFHLYLLRRLRVLTVTGDSMAPAIRDGETVLYDPWPKVNIGDIVFMPHPYMQSVKILKRVSEISADGNMILIGDNPAESTDSRTLGQFRLDDVQGKVVCKLN